ncbi:hypothetical protein DES53_10631 [Roseimicrobium gellanilyticum]|uniref:Uncharacterized protein n=1 Tax=Roseimicrobium gellanilyticum TaxID=748857 RepID=A0A366HHU1_9BACT|nr:hypothetical protein [Roseimicrobium gellanilyticum]RBP42327.1 hypothetical protein DES53_10631 [Roseimicrobium gellanilyticum]
MKPSRHAPLLALLLLTLACGPVMGSEEFIHPWKSVAITADGTPETGNIRVEGELSEQAYTSFRIHAFGREESLGKADLEKLKGYPLASIEVTSEPGYEAIGGYTVHARLKRTRYDDSQKLKTTVLVISLQKKGPLTAMQMPEGNPS